MRKTLIQRKEVGAAGAATIEFTDIPQTYTDLYLVVSARGTRSSNFNMIGVKFNDATTNLSSKILQGDGSTPSSFSQTDIDDIASTGNSATSNVFGNSAIYIPNYTSSNPKLVSADSVSENNATNAYQTITAGLWNDSAAITKITVFPRASFNFMQYSSASLYGVSKYNVAGGSPKATGGIISYDSTNDKWVHVFAASGTFTPSENLTAEYLVVAGGGGGGQPRGGGGGAGGYRCSVSGESSGGGASAETPLSLTASTGYTVTVGAGGNGGAAGSPGYSGSNGSNSVFSTITSTGGGYGAKNNAAGNSGGSGGGGGSDSDQSGGSGTTDQGYDGGSGGSTAKRGGGGGGAGSVGASGAVSADGGSGITSAITGSSVARAGGGGGGIDGTVSNVGGDAVAGGGHGGYGLDSTYGSNGKGENATANTGGGGGGGGGTSGVEYAGGGGNGGSGIVIVRYSA